MGPKGKRPNPSEKPFLFVNEDFNTLFGGARNADIDRTKQSHVQRQSFARRKRGTTKKRSEETSPATGNISPSAGSSVNVTESELSAIPSPQIQLRYPELTFATPDTAWLPAIQDHAYLAASQSLSQEPFPTTEFPGWQPLQSTWPSQNVYAVPQLLRANSRQITARLAYPSSERSSPLDNDLPMPSNDFYGATPSPSAATPDPFSDMKTALELWAPPLMRSYATDIVAELFDTDLQATSLANMRHVSGLHADMQSCMSQPAEMYALLAVTSLIVLSQHGQLDLPRLAPEDSARVPLLFKSKALEALRLRLANGNVTHGTVLAVHRMVCAALFNGNYSAVETHYRACISMMDSLGGLQTFNDFQKERLILHDLYYAFATITPPRLQVTWDPGPLPNEFESQLRRRESNGGSRLRAMIEESDPIINLEIGEAVLDFMETREMLQWLQLQPYRPGEYRWLMHRRLALVYKLLNLDLTSDKKTDLLAANQNVVRFAVVYYAMSTISYPFARILAINQFVAVVEQLWGHDNYQHAWLSSTDLLLWTVVMLNMCITFGMQSQRVIDAVHITELATRLSDIGRTACVELEIQSEEQLKAVLTTFLFEDRFVDERFKAFIQNGLRLTLS